MRYFVQQLPLQSYHPPIGAVLLNTTTYFNYPLSYLVGSDLKKLLRAVHEIQTYNRNQGSAGNKEMIRLALMSSSKEEFWDPLLQPIAAKYEAQGEKAIPIKFYHATSDSMVSLEASQLLVKWLEEAKCKVDFATIEGADHNTILIDPTNMSTILTSFAK